MRVAVGGGTQGAGLSPRWDHEGVSRPPVPSDAGYSALLILHVGSALVGFGALVLTGVQAARAARGTDGPTGEGLRRYFRPGVNWPARALYGVPLFGFALLADSRGAFRAGDPFVLAGLLLWLLAALLAELLVWPGERRIQARLAGEGEGTDLARTGRRLAVAAGFLAAVFLASTVLMVVQP